MKQESLTLSTKEHALINISEAIEHSANNGFLDVEKQASKLQMIAYLTLNSLSQIWIWWKDDLSGKQLGEG